MNLCSSVITMGNKWCLFKTKKILFGQIVFISSFYNKGLRMTVKMANCNLTSVKHCHTVYTLISPVYDNSVTHFCVDLKSLLMVSVLIVENLSNKVDYQIVLLLFVSIAIHIHFSLWQRFPNFHGIYRFEFFFIFDHQQRTNYNK